MALTRIRKRGIRADAVNEHVSFTNIVDTGTEGTKVAVGTTAQRGTTTGQWRYNSTTGYYEGRNTDGTFSPLEPEPIVSSVDDTEVDSAAGGNQTIVVTGQNFSSGGTIAFVGTSAEFNADTTTFNSATQVTAVAPKASFLNAQEPYKVRFTAASGKSGITSVGVINVDNAPAWTTSAGSLGNIYETDTGDHFTLAATDAEGDTVTYSETGATNITGAGLSLNSSTGVISGDPTDVGSDTTINFTGRATAGGKTADRSFSFLVKKLVASGGTKTTNGIYTIHTFLSTANFVLNVSKALDILIVGGGGSGGVRHGGGGGAGGLIEIAGATASSGTYVCTIGPGGGRKTGNGAGNDGTDTTFVCAANSVTFTANGGGGGASYGATTGRNGGSGGGAGPYHNNASLGLSSATQAASPSMTGLSGGTGVGYGFRGGGNPGSHAAGGGGGSGSIGGNSLDMAGGEASDQGGVGGDGRLWNLDGNSYYYAGGGGGGGRRAYYGGAGTHGGGGGNAEHLHGGTQGAGGGSARNAGSNAASNLAGSAGANTGSGGGGIAQCGTEGYSSSAQSGAGGSGIIIIRYLT